MLCWRLSEAVTQDHLQDAADPLPIALVGTLLQHLTLWLRKDSRQILVGCVVVVQRGLYEREQSPGRSRGMNLAQFRDPLFANLLLVRCVQDPIDAEPVFVVQVQDLLLELLHDLVEVLGGHEEVILEGLDLAPIRAQRGQVRFIGIANAKILLSLQRQRQDAFNSCCGVELEINQKHQIADFGEREVKARSFCVSCVRASSCVSRLKLTCDLP